MTVLTYEHIRASWVIHIVSNCSDVDEKTALGVDPSCINMVHGVLLVAVIVVRVDFEHVVAPIGDPRSFVVEDRHVVIGGEIVHACLGHLNVNV